MSTITSQIVGLLVAERNRIQAAIDALDPEPEWIKTNIQIVSSSAAPKKRKGFSAASKRKMAAAQHARWAAKRAAEAAPKIKQTLKPISPKVKAAHASHSDRMKAYWAAKRAATTEATAPKKKSAKAVVAEIVAPKEDAEFKSKMSIAMANSWKKRRAAAKKKAGK